MSVDGDGGEVGRICGLIRGSGVECGLRGGLGSSGGGGVGFGGPGRCVIGSGGICGGLGGCISLGLRCGFCSLLVGFCSGLGSSVGIRLRGSVGIGLRGSVGFRGGIGGSLRGSIGVGLRGSISFGPRGGICGSLRGRVSFGLCSGFRGLLFGFRSGFCGSVGIGLRGGISIGLRGGVGLRGVESGFGRIRSTRPVAGIRPLFAALTACLANFSQFSGFLATMHNWPSGHSSALEARHITACPLISTTVCA